jgi:hypothetical protein
MEPLKLFPTIRGSSRICIVSSMSDVRIWSLAMIDTDTSPASAGELRKYERPRYTRLKLNRSLIIVNWHPSGKSLHTIWGLHWLNQIKEISLHVSQRDYKFTIQYFTLSELRRHFMFYFASQAFQVHLTVIDNSGLHHSEVAEASSPLRTKAQTCRGQGASGSRLRMHLSIK